MPPGVHADGLNLYLQVSKNGSRSWLFRYMRNGKAHEMGLGPLHTITLAEARSKALELRKLLLEGRDPITERQQQRRAMKIHAAAEITFAQAAQRFIAGHKAGWRNAKHAWQWTSTLTTYAFPVIGEMPVAAVDTAMVLKILEPIWREKTETASRVRGRMESVLDWAIARDYRDGPNPARWRGHLDKLLPRRSKVAPVRNHPAMPYRQVPAFMKELEEREGISAKALRYTILTAARTGEVTDARWAEVDMEERVWTVPAERMKASKEHRVPLSDAAIQVLEEMPRIVGSPWLFPGARENQPLSKAAMHELLKGLRPGLTVHGFRSSFKDWASEETSHPGEVSEAALAHAIPDKVEAAYRRGDLFERRRRLMQDWADFLKGQRDDETGQGKAEDRHSSIAATLAAGGGEAES